MLVTCLGSYFGVTSASAVRLYFLHGSILDGRDAEFVLVATSSNSATELPGRSELCRRNGTLGVMLLNALESQTPVTCTGSNCITAALPLHSGTTICAVLLIQLGASNEADITSETLPTQAVGFAPSAPTPPPLPAYLLLTNPSTLQHVSFSVSMALTLSSPAVSDHFTDVAAALRRLHDCTSIQVLVSELSGFLTRHIKRWFFLEAVVQVALVPEQGAPVALLLRDDQGATEAAMEAAAALAVAAATPAPPGAEGRGWVTAEGYVDNPTLTTALPMDERESGVVAGDWGDSGSSGGRRRLWRPGVDRPTTTSPGYNNNTGGMRRTRSEVRLGGTLREAGRAPLALGRAASRVVPLTRVVDPFGWAAGAALTPADGSGSARPRGQVPVIPTNGAGTAARSPSPLGTSSAVGPSAGCHSANSFVGPPDVFLTMLRATPFKLVDTLLGQMILEAGKNRGGDSGCMHGTCSVGLPSVLRGAVVPDCHPHVQSLHRPSRDIYLLMASGNDKPTGASLAVGNGGSRLQGDSGKGPRWTAGYSSGRRLGGYTAGRGGRWAPPRSLTLVGVAVEGGPVVGLYIAFPSGLPQPLLEAVRNSCANLLDAMLARLIAHKLCGQLRPEVATLAAGVPGSYVVLPAALRSPMTGQGWARQPSCSDLQTPQQRAVQRRQTGVSQIIEQTGCPLPSGTNLLMMSHPDFLSTARTSQPAGSFVLRSEPDSGDGAGPTPGGAVVDVQRPSAPAPGGKKALQTPAGHRTQKAAVAADRSSRGNPGLPPVCPCDRSSFRRAVSAFSWLDATAAVRHRLAAFGASAQGIRKAAEGGVATAPAGRSRRAPLVSPRVGSLTWSQSRTGSPLETLEECEAGVALATASGDVGDPLEAILLTLEPDQDLGPGDHIGILAESLAVALKGNVLPVVERGARRPQDLPSSQGDSYWARKHSRLTSGAALSPPGDSSAEVQAPTLPAPAPEGPRDDDLLGEVVLVHMLGSGASGVVLQGWLGTVPMAVKLLELPTDEEKEMREEERQRKQAKEEMQDKAAEEADDDEATAECFGAPVQEPGGEVVAWADSRPKPEDGGVGGENGGGPGELATEITAAVEPGTVEEEAREGLQGEDGVGAKEHRQNRVEVGEGRTIPGLTDSRFCEGRRLLLRNAMELAVLREVSHMHIIQVFALFSDVVLTRSFTADGQPVFKLRHWREGDPLNGDQGDPETGGIPAASPPVVAVCMELADRGNLAGVLADRTFPRRLQGGPGRGGQGALHRRPGQQPRGRTQAVLDPSVDTLQGGLAIDFEGVYLTLLEIGLALRHLHSKRVVHRGIKPANILLNGSPQDPRGWTCKLADFGLALVLDKQDPSCSQDGTTPHEGFYTIQDAVSGTVTHMAPEAMMRGSRIDASVDMFAVGIIMWEITAGCGRQPYHPLRHEDICSGVRAGMRPVFPAGVVPPAYRTMAAACWSSEPHRRPSAAEFVGFVKAQLGRG